MRSGPPTKNRIADIAVKKAKRLTSVKPYKIPNAGTMRTPNNNKVAPCFTPLRRGELSVGGAAPCCAIGIMPPLASTCITPSSGKPHREQNLVISETCCWPHCGQCITGDLVYSTCLAYQL